MEKTRIFHAKRENMKLINDILESYDELCIIHVRDPERGIIEAIYPVNNEELLNRILKELENEGLLRLEEGGEDGHGKET